MESSHRVTVGWFALGLAALGLLGGCARPAPVAPRPGELEVLVNSAASYAVVGRFHLNPVEPGMPARELDFDSTTSSARVALAPGGYVLTLHAGARLVCQDESDTTRFGATAFERLVSAWPQRISIAPGEVTRARIGFGSAPTAVSGRFATAGDVSQYSDPCVGTPLDASVEQALLAQ